MAWTRKEQPHPLDNQPIEGLFFLVGDILAERHHAPWVKGEKMPLIRFRSGETCQLWEGREPGNPIVHLFGEMDLPLKSTPDEAFAQAVDIAEQVGYVVSREGENRIRTFNPDENEHVIITYENGQMVDVQIVMLKREEQRPAVPLLDAESRAKLPPLFSGEKLGLNAVAQVKFFTPDANWTWYASEASAILDDGNDVPLNETPADDPRITNILFFGLVHGYELEFGNFTLKELEDIRGPFGLAVERDRHFQPKTLGELQELHQRGTVG